MERYRDANRETLRDYARNYGTTYRDLAHVREYRCQYRHDNRTALRAIIQRWRISNIERYRAKRTERQQKLRDALHAEYIVYLIRRYAGLQNPPPELIAAKAAHLRVTRAIKNGE